MLDQNQADLGAYLRREKDDYIVEWFSGTGCGGQFRNKHQNSARVIHVPTGVTRSAQTRSRQNSLQNAMTAINVELDRLSGKIAGQAENSVRRTQIGNGERSDKRRTVRFQADEVVDHISGKRMTAKEYMRGGMEKLW